MTRYHDDEKTTAERILDAGARLLAAEGYASLSMRRVASEVGLSQAAIYRHFADKAELVGRIVGSGYGELSRTIEEAATREGEPEEVLASTFRAYIEFAAQRPDLFKALLLQDIGPAGTAVEAFSPGVTRRRRTFEILARLLRRGMDEGRFAVVEPELTAQALWAAAFGLVSRIVIEGVPNGAMRDALVDRHLEILIKGLRP